MIIPENLVAYARDEQAAYPHPPFSPGERYPEYPFTGVSSGPNLVYALVRESFRRLGLDRERFGSASWNPLGAIVHPGDSVVIKPNWVYQKNKSGGPQEAVTTHPSMVRALLDYIWIALGGEGTVVIGDAPIQGCRLDTLLQTQNWSELPDFYARNGKMKVILEDWRLEVYHGDAYLAYRKEIRDSDEEFALVDLGRHSVLETVSGDYENFRVTYYDPAALKLHHRPGKHEYCISKRIVEADVVFNVAKLKSHRLAGITCCMKNLVGINGHKSFLPHFRRGPATEGHDEYPKPNALKALQSAFADLHDAATAGWAQLPYGLARYSLLLLLKMIPAGIRFGAWHGNDTIWRTILDLNRILLYSDRDGCLQPSRRRKVFCLVDAVVAGEEEGPMRPKDRRCGAVLAGTNPLVVDTVAAKLMGLPAELIPQIAKGFDLTSYPIFDGTPDMISVVADENLPLSEWRSGIEPFLTPAGWRGLTRQNDGNSHDAH